ncbi:MAG: TIM barrel protein [Novosphingobium sp.]|nr:TIM barrel protein [Novosphingobium sp.]
MSAGDELSSCIEWQFAECGELDARLRAASDAGFTSAEFHLWRDKPVDALAEALAETGMRLTSICVDPRKSIVDPNERSAMVAAVREMIAAARKLGKPNLIVASGFRVEGLSEEADFANAVTALRAVADAAEEAGVTLLLEPLNTRLFASMYLVSTKIGLDLVEAVDSPNLRLLFDVWHSAVMGEDIVDVLDGRIHLVGHVQVADLEDRHEPGTGSLNWEYIMYALRRLGHSGAIGLDYIPSPPMEQSLALSRQKICQ